MPKYIRDPERDHDFDNHPQAYVYTHVNMLMLQGLGAKNDRYGVSQWFLQEDCLRVSENGLCRIPIPEPPKGMHNSFFCCFRCFGPLV